MTTVATEDQEQPNPSHEREARILDVTPGCRTHQGQRRHALRQKAGHMTAAVQVVRSTKLCLPSEAVHICDGGFLCLAMYLATEVWPISMPSLRRSPWIRGSTPERVGEAHVA